MLVTTLCLKPPFFVVRLQLFRPGVPNIDLVCVHAAYATPFVSLPTSAWSFQMVSYQIGRGLLRKVSGLCGKQEVNRINGLNGPVSHTNQVRRPVHCLLIWVVQA